MPNALAEKYHNHHRHHHLQATGCGRVVVVLGRTLEGSNSTTTQFAPAYLPLPHAPRCIDFPPEQRPEN
ncbi:hypothetical protein ZHAS_00015946 [Anopheles sinensis]|uniref:Uncharacterized protein n=1 Tax=Anopheles sinensis TaxID=74873 RepID=A0A084WCE5_ANOSI|nr:hypothetical protein ZHAS_00015946 [Anopheles sinensis]